MKIDRVLLPAVLLSIAVVMVFSPGCLNAAEVRREIGPRGGEAVEGFGGREVVRGPEGNTAVRVPVDGVYPERRAAERLDVLPYSALPVVVGDQTYYQDGNIYYLPCPDDPTSYCVVPPPQ